MDRPLHDDGEFNITSVISQIPISHRLNLFQRLFHGYSEFMFNYHLCIRWHLTTNLEEEFERFGLRKNE